MDRTLLKYDARERMRRYVPNPIVIGLIVFVLRYVLEYLGVSVLGINFRLTISNQNLVSMEDLQRVYEDLFSQYYTQLMNYHPSVPGMLIAVALALMELMVNTGHTIYALHVTREEKADYGNLLDGFAVFGRVLVLTLLESVFVFLWTCLFIVPGLIAMYRYRQAIYLLLDFPDRSPLECLRASSDLMRNHKAELFWLDVSFLGWDILCRLIRPVVVWVLPYKTLTFANYYRTLIGESVPPRAAGRVIEGEFTEIEDDDL